MASTSANVTARDLCGVRCRSEDDRNNYKNLVRNNEGNYTCNTCAYTSNKKENLIIHITRMHSSNTYDCIMCKITVISQHKYKKHQDDTHRSLINRDKFICICNKQFNHFSRLKLHYKTKHLSISNEDSFSDYIFLYRNGKKVYKCKYCKHEATRNNMQQHNLAMHSSETYTCVICDIVLTTQHNYIEHRGEHKSFDHPDQFICDVCKKVFPRLQHLIIHYNEVHLSDVCNAPYTCNVCRVGFQAKGPLGNHMNVHRQEMPFQCIICGNRYRLSNSLDTHVRQKHPEEY